ncbi:50S ribosomal protein L1 [Candidatus Woesearchaeota archaeon]|nr:50S ribosomal protein L1 [Candidatus Woesearchaeota archaeon]
MDKEQIQSALAKAKDNSKQRKFKQTYDLIINLKGLDPKKQEHQIDLFVALPHSRGRKVKVCALVGAELEEQAKNVCDSVIMSDGFDRHKDKKDVKKIANSYDFFIAQANIMPKVATAFGRVFGPRGKMPNPKSGCVVPPNANLRPLYEKLQRTIRANVKSAPLIQCAIGSEDMNSDEIAENALTVYSSLLQALPNEKHNIKDIYVKLTMGKPVKVGEKLEVTKEVR